MIKKILFLTSLLSTAQKINSAISWKPSLYQEASAGNYTTVKKMLENKADIHQSDRYSGATPLMAACACKIIDLQGENSDINKTVQVLLDYKSDPTLKTPSESTVLHLALTYGRHHTACKALLDAKADVSYEDFFGQTPLMAAVDDQACKYLQNHVFSPYKHTIPLLLAYKASIDYKNKNGETVFTLAKRVGNYQALEILEQYNKKED